MVNIPFGAELAFTPTGTKVKVAGDKQIEYNERIYSLSGFTAEFMPENKRNRAGAYCGPDYFTYNGEVLSDIRDRMEYDMIEEY